MAKVDLDVETSLPPERVREALLDFSERRPDVWPGLTRSLYELYSVSETSADVKEGTKMPFGSVWAREHYDWSDPQTVSWTVRESNFCAPGSFVSATLEPREGGGTRIHVHWERTGTTLAGRIATGLIAATRGRPVRASIENGLRRLER
jgi:Polyketide cyclase / dehydrase and lipid transport